VPRLRQKEGQEIDRDVAQGILTQACASHYTAAHTIAFSQIPKVGLCCLYQQQV